MLRKSERYLPLIVSVCTFMCIYLFSCPSVPAPQLLIFHQTCLCFVFTLKSKLDFHAFTYRIMICHVSRCTRDHVFTSIFSVFHASRFRKKAIHVSHLDPFQTHYINRFMIVISQMNIAETCMQIIWRAALSSSHHAMCCCHHSVSIARSRM
jgi:hypothetical protein